MMTSSEFERIVRLGLGRAVLELRASDPRPFREAILQACRHDLTFDRQVEGSRVHYLLDLIQSSGEPELFRREILAALATTTDEDDLRQLFELTGTFAREGDAEARDGMYRRFATIAQTRLSELPSIGAEELVRLDGIEGFLFVADCLGERARSDKGYWDDAFLLRLTEDQAGAEVVRRAVEQARGESLNVAVYLDVVERVEESRDQSARGRLDPRGLSYDALKQRIEGDGEKPRSFLLGRWGRSADTRSLEQAAQDLLDEPSTSRRLMYLRIFRRKAFPLGPEPLLPLARGPDDELAAAALDALSNLQGPLVRQLAIDLLTSGRRPHVAIPLLEKNYQDGDHRLLERALQAERDVWIYHALGFGIIGVFEANPTRDSRASLLELYEHGPCSECREHCVELLHRLGMLPDRLVEECRYDANPYLQAKVRRY